LKIVAILKSRVDKKRKTASVGQDVRRFCVENRRVRGTASSLRAGKMKNRVDKTSEAEKTR
jgi:hypothetical protein